MALIGLTIGSAGIRAAIPTIWVFPTTLLTQSAAAAGVVLINSVGNAGGFFSPAMIGWTRAHRLVLGGAGLPGRRVRRGGLVALRLGSMMRHLLTTSAPGHPECTDPEIAR